MKDYKIYRMVYRVAKICELIPLNQKVDEGTGEKFEERKHLNHEQAMEISRRISERKGMFFENLRKDLPREIEIEIDENDNIANDIKEGPITIFPQFLLTINGEQFSSRFCATVCMGENRSKLWVRLASKNSQNTQKCVKRFHAEATKLSTKILESVFNSYKCVVEETIEDTELISVYTIPVMGVEIKSEKMRDCLEKFRANKVPMSKAFEEYPYIFQLSAETIFPFSDLKIKKLDDYDFASLDNYEWITVEGASKNGFSIFLKYKNDAANETRFTGFGKELFIEQEDGKIKNIEQGVMLESTRSILELIMPNI